MNQHSLLVSEINLQVQPVGAFNNRFHCGFFDSASMQVYADVLADLELAVWLLWFAGHGLILTQQELEFQNS